MINSLLYFLKTKKSILSSAQNKNLKNDNTYRLSQIENNKFSEFKGGRGRGTSGKDV